jgi:hypothetical protein
VLAEAAQTVHQLGRRQPAAAVLGHQEVAPPELDGDVPGAAVLDLSGQRVTLGTDKKDYFARASKMRSLPADRRRVTDGPSW